LTEEEERGGPETQARREFTFGPAKSAERKLFFNSALYRATGAFLYVSEFIILYSPFRPNLLIFHISTSSPRTGSPCGLGLVCGVPNHNGVLRGPWKIWPATCSSFIDLL
jgi:hypothetical protein